MANFQIYLYKKAKMFDFQNKVLVYGKDSESIKIEKGSRKTLFLSDCQHQRNQVQHFVLQPARLEIIILHAVK